MDHFSFKVSGTPKTTWIFISLFVLTALFTNMRQNVVTNYQCEICSDKAGYFMYLPASFYYGFKASEFPENEDSNRGLGFTFNQEENKVITKFTSGIAILQVPFYGLGFGIDDLFTLENKPFSKYYLVWISIGSSFYLMVGLFYLNLILQQFYSSQTALYTTLLTFFGTNLLYYSIDENLMSHLYSFVLCCLSIYYLLLFLKARSDLYYSIFILVYGFAILVRPTNFLFGPLGLWLGILSTRTNFSQLLKLVTTKRVITGMILLVIVFLPQMVYWQSTFGKWIVWSYEGEGFSNALTPFFWEVWFSPQGGLFTYTPLILISLVFGVLMVVKKIKVGWLVLFTFAVISYLCASWHTPFFGLCNFGKRPFVEFYPFLIFPIAYVIETVNKNKQRSLFLLMGMLIYFNLTFTGVFDTCFYGDTWGWNEYFNLVGKGLILFR